MRDDNDGFTVVAHRAEYGKQLIDFLRGENGSRLVQNENIRAAI